jgi:hypothetical protein
VSNRKERAVSRRAKLLQEKGGSLDLLDSWSDSRGGLSSGTFGFDDEDHEIDDEVAIEVDLPSGGVGYRRGGLVSAASNKHGVTSPSSSSSNMSLEDSKASAALNFINTLKADEMGLTSDAGEAADLLEMLTMAGMDDEPSWEDTTLYTKTAGAAAPSAVPSKVPVSSVPAVNTSPAPLPIPPISSPALVTKEQLSAADEELSALADLERELGLDTSDNAAHIKPPTTTTTTTTTTAVANIPSGGSADEEKKKDEDNYDFDDDLEDFEGYLQSLTTSPK